ncbi:MAG: primosomal protein N' [Clostridiaceae bacterium]|jgi:primosomal protein N' (replication factor Y)|nr:primosomal protein N' [Clostridiaceae bacterium]
MLNIASVVLSAGLRSFDKLYDYIIPDHFSAEPGMRVLVPFGARNKLQSAWIIQMRQDETKRELKRIHSIVDEYPLLNQEILKLSEWMKNRYLCTRGDAINCMIPAGVNLTRQRIVKAINCAPSKNITPLMQRICEAGSQGILFQELSKEFPDDLEARLKELKSEGLIEIHEFFQQRVGQKKQRAVYPVIDETEFRDLYDEGKVRSVYQARVMDFLFEEGLCFIQDLLLIPGVSHATIRALRKKGWVEYEDVEVERDPFEALEAETDTPPVPTAEQKRALDKLVPLLNERKLNEALLFGVTGSGKTEVYLRLIEEVIRLGRTAIVLVPEISLTPQMVSRFTGRFGKRVAIQHSRLSLGERYDQWQKIRKGEVDVVIGARSAIFAPLTNLGIVIVDEEHELTYKSEQTPKYDARHVARARCNINGALLLLGSATPSIETYARAEAGKIMLIELATRANTRPLPQVHTVDMRLELSEGNRGMISRALEEELVRAKLRGEQAILFLNKRGYASFLLCRDCGYVMRCPNCSVSMTYHRNDRHVICHYCGYSVPVPKVCPGCKGEHFKPMGSGTQRIEEELLNHEAGFRVLRMDLDTTGTKYGHKRILEAFRDREADILIGTQMVAKGHDFPNVTLVGILAADAMLFSEDYRSAERTFQLVTQASGRAGRGDKGGKVILQAYNIDDYALQAAMKQDFKTFFSKEIPIRKQLNHPPFTHVGMVMVSSTNNSQGWELINKLHKTLMDKFGHHEHMMVSKPLRAPIFVIRNRMRWRIIIKHPSTSLMLEIMRYVMDMTGRMRLKETTVSVDIDPVNML